MMKTFLIAATSLVLAAPAFADGSTVGEGVVVMGGPNAVSVPAQLAAASDALGMDPVTVIRVNAAQSDDDSMALYALQTGPETVSTQSVSVGVGAQLLSGIGADASAMSLSDAASAYFDEVAD